MGGKSSKQEAKVLTNNISQAAGQQSNHLGKPKGPSQAPVLASPAQNSSKMQQVSGSQVQGLNRDDS